MARRANMVAEDAAVYDAMNILRKRVKKANVFMTDPASVRTLIQMHLMEKEHEVFSVIFLNARHGVIAVEDMFHGSLTGAAVYIGRVARRALILNSAAIIVAHNHPSGDPTPSHADRELTERLRQGLALIDIRLLDHVVVGGDSQVSFAERGWL